MADVVQQAMHPMLQEEIERMEAAHQVEMREMRNELEEKIEDLQDQVDRAACSFDMQFSALDDLLKVDKEGKPVPIHLDDLKEVVNIRLGPKYNDWDALYPMREIIERLVLPVQVREIEVERIVYKVPPAFRQAVEPIIEALKKLLE